MIVVGLLVALITLEPFQTIDILEYGYDEDNLSNDFDLFRGKRQDDTDGKPITPYQWKNKFHDGSDETWACHQLYMTKEMPFIAIILFKTTGRFMCMGTIIDTSHILSAKKCFERTDPGDLLVLVGYFKAYWGTNSQVLKVQKIVRHEGHVLMIKLKSAMTFNEYVQSVRLPSDITRAHNIIESYPPPYKTPGFTLDKFLVPGEYIAKEKRYIIRENQIVDFDDCSVSYPTLFVTPHELFCIVGNTSFCWGIRGAPVMKWMTDSHYLIVGVVVADNCSAHANGPYVVARTDTFTDWIRGNSYHGRDKG